MKQLRHSLDRDARQASSGQQLAHHGAQPLSLFTGIGGGGRGGDEGAPTTLGGDESFMLELVIGFLDSERRDDELLGQLPLRRELVAGSETSPSQGVGDLSHDLTVDGKLAAWDDDEVHGGGLLS